MVTRAPAQTIGLTPEQFLCFRRMSDDLRAAAANERIANTATAALRAAFLSGSDAAWRRAVGAVSSAISARTMTVSGAWLRLMQFVSENQDLQSQQ